jgi:hypothetical protein
MKEDLNHASGVVAGLYRAELSTRPDIGPFTRNHPFADVRGRNQMWINLANLHEDPVAIRMGLLRTAVSHSYQLGGADRIAPVFSGYFDRESKVLARKLRDMGINFNVQSGIGEREMFLADILNHRVPVPPKGERLHQAKSVLLSELLGAKEAIDMIPVEYKYPETTDKSKSESSGSGNRDNLVHAEILRLIKVSRIVSKFTFADIIRAVLEGRISLDEYKT